MVRGPWWLFSIAGLACAGVTDVQVIGTTSTQAVLSYTAPDSNSCSLEVSESPIFSSVVHDVNPALFANADRDDRPGNISAGQQRVFVIGARKADRANSFAVFSRALQANTAYYFRLTCSGDTVTGSFRTSNIPLGSTHLEALETDPVAPGRYLHPSANVLLQSSFVDPKTGLLVKNLNTLDWAYAASTGPTGASFAAVEDPSGTWSNPNGVLASGGNAASYSGNGRDWLWLRYPPYPTSSTITNNTLSFQNILLNGYCEGPECTTGGQTLEVCVTRLGIDEDGPHCEAPVREINLPTAAATITLCGEGDPCKRPARPGDILTFDAIPTDETRPGKGYIYNSKADYKQVFFTDVTDCRRLRPNDVIQAFSSAAVSTYQLTVDTLNCVDDGPSMMAKNAVPLDFNGQIGVPFYYATGARANVRYGILVRKKSSSAQSTIYLDWAGWRAATAANATFANGSGGFNRVCSKGADAKGFYHCHAGNNLITGIRTEEDGSLTVRFLGMAYLFVQSVPGLRSGFQFFGGSLNDFLWDDSDPNVMYFTAPSSFPSGGLAVVKATYTGDDVACGEPGAACRAATPDGSDTQRWPQLPARFQLLTPCVNGCKNPEDDFTLQAQFARYTAGKDIPFRASSFPACSIEAVAGATLVLSCRQGQQDTFSWLFAFDLGNGKPIGEGYVGQFGNTQQVFAALPIFARQASRWCTLHTYQNIHTEGIATPEFQIEKSQPFSVRQVEALAACSKAGSGNCEPCPPMVVNGVDYTGRNICGTLNITSAWNDAWGVPPGEFQPGEPVSTLSNLHWLQTLSPGDPLTHGGEVLRILQKIGAGQYLVERGVGDDQSYQFPRAHAAGSVWTTGCDAPGAHWFYERQPDGADTATYFATPYVNHALGRDGVRLHPEYGVSLAPFQPEEMTRPSYSASIALPNDFHGKTSSASGNAIEKHPSYGQEDAAPEDQRWFVDAHPYLFTGNASGTKNEAIPIEGALYRYRYTGTLDPKHYDLAAFTGQFPLTDISGPASAISGSSADSYKVCYAYRAGECVEGSLAGNVFFNVPALDVTTRWCREGEFYSGWRDICIANFNVIGGSYAQWGLPDSPAASSRNFSRGRVLTRLFEGYRGSATTNAKPTPDGKWMLFRSNLIAKLPPYPAADEFDRSKFLPMALPVPQWPDSNVDNAVVEFGYDAQNLYCTNRAEKCVSNTEAFAGDGFDRDNPFWFAQTDLAEKGGSWNGSGVSCSSGCSIAIPALAQRVLYYRVIYRDASNRVLHTGDIHAAASR